MINIKVLKLLFQTSINGGLHTKEKEIQSKVFEKNWPNFSENVHQWNFEPINLYFLSSTIFVTYQYLIHSQTVVSFLINSKKVCWNIFLLNLIFLPSLMLLTNQNIIFSPHPMLSAYMICKKDNNKSGYRLFLVFVSVTDTGCPKILDTRNGDHRNLMCILWGFPKCIMYRM
jgi:hypothetical protein